MSAVPQIPPESRSSAAASQDRRIQMLRTAMGPLIAAALEDPDVVEIMLNPDRTLWVDRLSSVARRWAWRCPRPMVNASSAWSPRMSARRCIAASRSDRRVAGNRRAFRGHPASGRPGASLRATQAGREHHRPGSLRGRRHP